MIEELIQTAAAKTRLDASQARTALAGALSLIDKHGDNALVHQLFDAIPGAKALAAEGGAGQASGGLLGGLLKSVAGGPAADAMAMLGDLSKDGIDANDLKALLPVAMDWVRSKTGRDLLRDVLGSIPGVGGLLA